MPQILRRLLPRVAFLSQRSQVRAPGVRRLWHAQPLVSDASGTPRLRCQTPLARTLTPAAPDAMINSGRVAPAPGKPVRREKIRNAADPWPLLGRPGRRLLRANPCWFAGRSGKAAVLAGSRGWQNLQDHGPVIRCARSHPPPVFGAPACLDLKTGSSGPAREAPRCGRRPPRPPVQRAPGISAVQRSPPRSSVAANSSRRPPGQRSMPVPAAMGTSAMVRGLPRP